MGLHAPTGVFSSTVLPFHTSHPLHLWTHLPFKAKPSNSLPPNLPCMLAGNEALLTQHLPLLLVPPWARSVRLFLIPRLRCPSFLLWACYPQRTPRESPTNTPTLTPRLLTISLSSLPWFSTSSLPGSALVFLPMMTKTSSATHATSRPVVPTVLCQADFQNASICFLWEKAAFDNLSWGNFIGSAYWRLCTQWLLPTHRLP